MKELPFRQIHLDFHTSPFIQGVGSDFNAEHFIHTLQKARVNSINIFAKCHHGMCYYPTKVGTVHPELKFDLLGEMIKACRDAGIRAPIYLPTGWSEDAAEHQEWLEISKDGLLGDKKPFSTEFHGWRKLCHNKEGFIVYLEQQIEELMELYEVDGFFFDIVHQRHCVCADCLKEMKTLELDPLLYDDLKKHDFIVMMRFLERIYTFIKVRKPDAAIYFNMFVDPDNADNPAYSIKQKNQFQTQIELESLPSGIWGYNHLPLCINYFNEFDKEIVGMNGKFHYQWGDFGTIRNLEALEYECFRAVANGAKCCIGDQLHPRGELDESVYEQIGEVYQQIEAIEPWCANSKKISEIAILLANRSLERRFTSDEGAMRMLMELGRPFSFIDREADFNKFACILLPDTVWFDADLAAKFSAYLEQGGTAIATYKSGMDLEQKQFLFTELGVTYEEENPFCPTYVRVDSDFSKGMKPFDYVMYNQGAKVAAAADNENLAYLSVPYFNRTYDRFCSHRHSPVDKGTAWPAITRRGSVIYIANPLFADYIEHGVKVHRDIIERCLNLLVEQPLLVTTLPSTAEITLRKQADKLILHVLHYIPQKKSRELDIVDVKIPLYEHEVKLRMDKAPSQIYIAPTMQDLPFSYENGYASFTIPKINGYIVVAVMLNLT